MAVQLESAERLAALRDKADAVTGERSATLAGAVDALIAGFGAGGGGTVGSLESGEFTGTRDSFYKFTIPVTSKKSHILIWPQQMGHLIANPNESPYVARRICVLLGEEGSGLMEVSIKNAYNGGFNTGDCYWYDESEANAAKIIYNDTYIDVTIAYSPWGAGWPCNWIAW